MSLITTNDGRIVFKKAQSMMAVPYVYDSTIGDYVLGSDVYDISAIIGDTITLEQSDGNTEAKYNEFVGTPLIENISGGKYEFKAECIDLQNNVLKSLFGVLTASGGAAAFNADYVEMYALIRVRFEDAALPNVVLPKVHLNSKLFIQQLRTRMSQGNISGTALPLNCAIENNGQTALSPFTSIYSSGTYTPFTPVLFVPRGRVPLFYKKKQSDTLDTYSSINFTSGTVSDVSVNPSNGSLPTPGGGGGEGGGEGGGGDA